MLDFAQINEDKFRSNYEEFNIREAIDKVLTMQMQKAESKGIQLTVQYLNIGHNDSIEQDYSPIINCDENRIMQVLLGL